MPPAGTSARGDARRRQILDGALAAIREQPLADVQLAAIAARAGLKPNHVLYYFASRDAVLIAAVAHAEQELAAGRSERLRAIDDPEERHITRDEGVEMAMRAMRAELALQTDAVRARLS